ncbi:MAG: cellulase family glycosylhydrolase [Anaerolineae bacterium]
MPTPPPSGSPSPDGVLDKWSLWSGETQLRGANVYQRRVYPELDGPDFFGPGPLGPPLVQADFDRLAAMGANYVNLSHPGLYTEKPPYVLDVTVQDNLDRLLAMVAQADMFAVISFRSGPGRSEFTFFGRSVGDWFDESYLNDSIWQDPAAQEAWVEMWRYTANRYRNDPFVVGYDLMVEPNSNSVGGFPVGDPLRIWDPAKFYALYGDTLYDWNQLHPRIGAAIREVDARTPILVGGNGYSGVDWLPYVEPSGDPRTVYMAHQYAPHPYTHPWASSLECAYPGTCDLDGDGQYDDGLDRTWLEDLLSTVSEFKATHGVPVAINEFGVARWAPGGARFLDDEIDLFEREGLNYALWEWSPSWEAYRQNNAFNYRFGPDPDNWADVEANELMVVIQKYWARNTLRPSTVSTSTACPATAFQLCAGGRQATPSLAQRQRVH